MRSVSSLHRKKFGKVVYKKKGFIMVLQLSLSRYMPKSPFHINRKVNKTVANLMDLVSDLKGE